MKAHALLSLLYHSDKALDLVQTAWELGLIARLDEGPATLGELATATRTRPLRLYKFLDGLESLGFVIREQRDDDPLSSQYVSSEPLAWPVQAILGDRSIERVHDHYPWRDVHGRLEEVLRGHLDARYTWPPATDEEVREFETSMGCSCAPIVAALRGARHLLFAAPADEWSDERSPNRRRWLDVGGGDGIIAEALLREDRSLSCDVFNLPRVAPLACNRIRYSGLHGRLGFIPGDFLNEPLPSGYDVLSFIRVLHEWPADVARTLLVKARHALEPGGRIVVCEAFRTRERLAGHLFWTYFLVGVDTCVTTLREIDWYRHTLSTLGFTDIRDIPGEIDILTAVAA